ncbi:hypothetical protein Smp_176960 [Schistosoma mansoni]|uniref:hypothetical protein n=1 Tax=Schistosoma mansoni TaxID=6183 RepID=UPI0001A61BE4|nr:hypothetical protein Smp_176960 [Schistosoma mansoni]|eukprot:XP_018649298.1 hypothetical protein Smp_176960 [Schistosoma mansoni]
MRSNKCEFIHLRLTESLLCSLENIKQNGGKIALVCEPQQNPKIVVTTSGSDSVYELEPDHGTVYFSLVNVKKSVGKCLQNIQYRYRTKATDDSFVKARENLVKEVENSRQQKIKALDYQLKSASLIKDERNTKARNPSFSSLSSKKKSVQRPGTSPQLITNSLVNIKENVSDKSDQQKVTHTSGTAEDYVNDIEKVIYNKCLSAVQRRNVLEQRLREAYTNTDEFVRTKEIEKIKMDLSSLVDDLYTDELLKKWIPMSIGSA